jgi:hypothetical protein
MMTIYFLKINIFTLGSNGKLWDLFSYDTVFTVSVTLFVFSSGILIDRLIKHLETKKRHRELRHYFMHFLDRLTYSTCLKLNKIYKKVYQAHEINEGISTAPPKIYTSDFARIRNIQDKELFHAFKDKKSLSTILSNLDYLELMINEVDNYHKLIKNDSDNLRKPLHKKINKYFDTLARYGEHIRINNPQYPHQEDFENLVNDSIFRYHQQQGLKQQLAKVYKTIIHPIQEMLVQSNIFRVDPIGFEIAELGKDISIQYESLRLLTVKFRLDYREFSSNVRQVKKNLSEERKKINWD